MNEPKGLRSAVKAARIKSPPPYVWIGEEPFPSRLLKTAFSGDFQLERAEFEERGLRLRGRSGRVKRSYLIYNVQDSAYCVQEGMRRWANQRRRKDRARSQESQSLSKYGRAIRKLEKEAARVYVNRPVNPMLARDSFLHPACEMRESYAGWVRDRPKRKALARITGSYIVKQRTVWNQSLRPLYKELLATGWKFQRYGGIPKRSKPKQIEYLRHLWKYVGVHYAKPNTFDWRELTREQRDADIRKWIDAQRLRDMLQDQIRTLRDLETWCESH